MEFLSDNLLFIMQCVTLLVSIYIAFTSKVKRILIADFIVNFSLLACYAILGDITTVLMYVSISIRSFLYIYKDKFHGNWLPIVAIIVQLVLGFATIENPLQILAIALPCFVCWYMWFWQDDKQKIRLGNIINNGGWGVYNALTGLWIVVIMRVFVVACNAVSIYRTSTEQNSCLEEAPMFDEDAASEA